MGTARGGRRRSQAETLDAATDLVPEDAPVWAWGYRLDDLRSHAAVRRSTYEVEPVRAILQALQALPSARSKQVREADFLVWTGEYFMQYWIAVPYDIHNRVMRELGHWLEPVVGYDCLDSGQVSTMCLVPRYRYERGITISYREPEMAGQTALDTYYATNVLLHFRNTTTETALKELEKWAPAAHERHKGEEPE